MNKKEIWTLWEKIACKFLLEKWYKYKTNHYQKQIWEIDLIFEDNWEIVFVEVKTRNNDKYWEWFEAIDMRKIKKMIKTWEFYCLENNINFDKTRFDVISIFLQKNSWTCKIKHLKKII